MKNESSTSPANEPSSASRRDVLKGLAAGTAGLLFSPYSLLAATRPKKDKLGIALVGLGYYSTDLLAPALQQTKNAYLAGIVTGTPSKAEAWQKKYNIPDKNIYNYQTFEQLANNDDIDVVYIVLPPSMHKEYVIRAANTGKHVFCEKPMALTGEECQAMIDACNSRKRKLAIGYRLQHEPNTQAWRKVVKDKSLGNVKKVNCAAGYFETRTNHWKQNKAMGGGVMYDMGVYPIQGLRMGTGMEPVAIVSAQTSTTRPEIYKDGLDEIAIATLEFPGGVMGDMKATFGENTNFININFDKGDLKMQPYSEYAGQKGGSSLGEIHFPYSVPFQQSTQIDDDCLSIINNKPMLCPGEEGQRDIRIVEAIHLAAKNGQRVKL